MSEEIWGATEEIWGATQECWTDCKFVQDVIRDVGGSSFGSYIPTDWYSQEKQNKLIRILVTYSGKTYIDSKYKVENAKLTISDLKILETQIKVHIRDINHSETIPNAKISQIE